MIMNTRTIMQPHLVNASSMADVLDTIQNVIMVTEGIRNHAKIAVSAYMRSGAELTPEQAQCVRDLSRAVDTIVRTLHRTRVPTSSLTDMIKVELAKIMRAVTDLNQVLDEKRSQTIKVLVLRIRDEVQALERVSMRDTPEERYRHV